ncbi:MAG: hypothetical protein IKI29_01465 [Clostridia bacterium]|nr:hypothetical protein [Clostridia bacterium]
MNYIILDLEWDSVFHKKHRRFVNQILQIGAVKLNESFEVDDSIEITIHSALSNRVTGRFARLTGITKENMQKGVPADEAVEQFNRWAGKDTVTLTWSTSDLFTIYENEQLVFQNARFHLEKYVDLQAFIQNEMKLLGWQPNGQISLSGAAEFLRINTDGLPLHTARADCLLAAAMLQKCYHPDRFAQLIQDTRSEVFQKRLFFKPYYLNKLSDPAVDRKQMTFVCENCGNCLKRTSGWNYRNRWFIANFHCKKCALDYSGRICFRQTFDQVIIKKKLLPVVAEKAESEQKRNEMQRLPETM